jgi:hypothetical protein
MHKYKLAKDIDFQSQPDDMTCWPTCLAMALGVSVKYVLEAMEARGLKFYAGMKQRDISFFLCCLGIGAKTFPNIGHGVSPGLYICEVPSLNVTGYTHAVLLKISEHFEPFIYDPNTGREGKALYCIESYFQAPIISYTELDDFSDYVQEGEHEQSL